MSSSLAEPMSSLGLPWQESKDMQVTLGGIQGFSDLADLANISKLLTTGRVSIYMHWASMYQGAYNVDWIPGVNAYGLLPKIADVFAGTGGGVLELNCNSGQTDADVNSYFQGILVGAVQDQGFHPTEVNINLDDYTDQESLEEFKQFVTIGESYGLKNFAPVFSPNNLSWDLKSFMDPQWDYVRQEALMGGGIAIDAPPSFYFNPGTFTSEYEAFTQQEIKWATSNGLRASVIISPNNSGTNYLSLTQQFVENLIQAGAVPTQWDVENYDVVVPADYPNSVGSEDIPDTEANVALWVAQNAPITQYTISPQGVWTGNSVIDPSGRLLQSADLSGNTTTYNYDPDGNLAGTTLTNATGQKIKGTDSVGDVTTYSYDLSGELSGTATANSAGQEIKSTDAAGNVTSYSYNANGELTGTVTSNSSGQKVKSTDSVGDVTSYSYDVNGKLISTITRNPAGQVIQEDPDGELTTYRYDSSGNLIGTITTNSMGQEIKSTDAAGNSTAYSYDQNGNQTTTITTNSAGLVIQTTINVWSAQALFINTPATTVTTKANDTVYAGGGSDTIFAAGPSTLVNGGTGHLTFVGGSGSSTVLGGAGGNSTIWGGAGGGWFAGGSGGHNILVAQSGNTTLQGGGSADLMFGSASGNGNLLRAGPGSEFLIEGTGATTVTGGGGTYVAFGGTGQDTYVVNAGTGGTDVIVGFKPGIDRLDLNGFDVAHALANTSAGAWGTAFVLSDGTELVLFGVQGLSAGSFV